MYLVIALDSVESTQEYKESSLELIQLWTNANVDWYEVVIWMTVKK